MENVIEIKKEKKEKIYTVNISHSKRGDKQLQLSLADLISYFSYTLEIGKSWNSKIDRNPKTIKSFIKNINLSYDEKEGACYERTYISLI